MIFGGVVLSVRRADAGLESCHYNPEWHGRTASVRGPFWNSIKGLTRAMFCLVARESGDSASDIPFAVDR